MYFDLSDSLFSNEMQIVSYVIFFPSLLNIDYIDFDILILFNDIKVDRWIFVSEFTNEFLDLIPGTSSKACSNSGHRNIFDAEV